MDKKFIRSMSIRDAAPTNFFFLFRELSPHHPSPLVFYCHIGTRVPQGLIAYWASWACASGATPALEAET